MHRVKPDRADFVGLKTKLQSAYRYLVLVMGLAISYEPYESRQIRDEHRGSLLWRKQTEKIDQEDNAPASRGITPSSTNSAESRKDTSGESCWCSKDRCLAGI